MYSFKSAWECVIPELTHIAGMPALRDFSIQRAALALNDIKRLGMMLQLHCWRGKLISLSVALHDKVCSTFSLLKRLWASTHLLHTARTWQNSVAEELKLFFSFVLKL